MTKIDFKHTAFHVLAAIYFLWCIVYSALLFMAASNALSEFPNLHLNNIFLLWIILNLIMGTVLFIVISLFRNRTIISRVILYSYTFLLGVSIGMFFLIG